MHRFASSGGRLTRFFGAPVLTGGEPAPRRCSKNHARRLTLTKNRTCSAARRVPALLAPFRLVQRPPDAVFLRAGAHGRRARSAPVLEKPRQTTHPDEKSAMFGRAPGPRCSGIAVSRDAGRVAALDPRVVLAGVVVQGGQQEHADQHGQAGHRGDGLQRVCLAPRHGDVPHHQIPQGAVFAASKAKDDQKRPAMCNKKPSLPTADARGARVFWCFFSKNNQDTQKRLSV